MKKLFRFLPLLLIPLLFTSCIDYVQSITYTDGKYQMYYKITLSKVFFAMVGQDSDQIFNDFDKEAKEGMPDNIEIKPVNTDLEVGAEFIFHIDPRTNDETEKSFLPTIAGRKIFIPFLLGENDANISDSMKSDDSETQGMILAIMSSAKCRIMISKKIIPEIETAYFEGRDDQNYTIPFFDYGDSYCMEIPFVVLFENSKYIFDKIVVMKP